MKLPVMIIASDPLDREGPGFDDKFICAMENKDQAERIVAMLNDDPRRQSLDWYFHIKPHDYKLQKFEP